MSKVYVLRFDNPTVKNASIHCIYSSLEEAQEASVVKRFAADQGWSHTSYGWFIEEWSLGILEANQRWYFGWMGWVKS